jgi:FtsP/CotA-like multicopper oxidase with cupredoxin domain
VAGSPIGRRGFLAGAAAGGAALVTLGGLEYHADAKLDVEAMGSQLEVPPAVSDYYRRQSQTGDVAGPRAHAAAGGVTREYWIKAVRVPNWDIVPSHRDGMMDRPVKGKTKITALAYQRFHPGFKKPIGRPSIPGPLIEADVGDTVVINFRNECGMPVTMHPHGIFYTVDMDGTYKGKYTTPGGFVENGRTFQYVWEARQDTVGAWLYHDHGPMDPIPVFKGLFGSLIIRDPTVPRPDREFFICLHSFTPPYISLDTQFMCINGRAYAGNTPTLRAKTGETVTWHVYALDNNFHTFHLHGHRWLDTDGGYLIDTKTLGPADIITLNYTEDNPGRWFYHCHVFSHLHMGMNGWYIVSE